MGFGLTKINATYKKGTQLSSFSIYTRNKAGNARTIAPLFHVLGGDINMNIFSLLNIP